LKRSISKIVLLCFSVLFLVKGLVFIVLPDLAKSLYIVDVVISDAAFNQIRYVLGFNLLLIGLVFFFVQFIAKKYIKVFTLFVVLSQLLLLVFHFLGNNLDSVSLQVVESLLVVFIGILALLLDYRNLVSK
jgi:uncharacterized protein YjeT (DUF2065 family)